MLVSSVMQVIGRSAGGATSSLGSPESSFTSTVSSGFQSNTAGAPRRVMGEIGDPVAVHLEIGGDGRAAQLGVGGGGGVRIGEPSQPGNIPGQLQNSAIVDLVQHCFKSQLSARLPHCHPRPNE